MKKLTIEGKIIPGLPDVDVGGLTVELRDQNQNFRGTLATGRTNHQGDFTFKLNPLALKRQFKATTPEVFFVINKDDRHIFSTLDDVVIKLDQDVRNLKIVFSKNVSASLVEEKRKLPKLDIAKLLIVSGVKTADLPIIVAKLKRGGLSSATAILSKPGKLTVGRTGMSKEILTRFKALTKFAAAGGSHSLSAKLVDRGFASLSDIGAISKSTLAARLGKLNKAESNALDMLYRKAVNMHNDVMNQAAFSSRLSGSDGLWLLDKKKYEGVKQNDQCGCEACKNAFSPYAYLINLLDMIHHHWRLATKDLEQVLLQDIDDLNCEKGQESFLQIELAVAILEKHKGISLPLTDHELNNDVEKIWVKLLFGDDSNDNLLLFRKLGQNGSNALKELLHLLNNPGAGIDGIKKGYKRLKAGSRIGGLKAESRRYAEGGEQFDTASDRAYAEVVVHYRAALIRSIKLTAEQLQDVLFIDLKAGACNKTNRITFLILSLQAFVMSVRTGKIAQFNRPDLNTNFRNRIRTLSAIPVEEASWKWLKDYPSWASAMYVFLFPENVTIPFFGDDFHIAFRDQREVLFGSLDNNQDAVKNAYLTMISTIIGGDLAELSAHSGGDYFFYPEYGLIYDVVFFPPEHTFQENTSAALLFIEAINDNPSLDAWLNAIDTYMVYLGLNALLEEKLFFEQRLFFPLMAAWTLNRSEDFAAAHDWYRQLYDPTKSGGSKFVFQFDAHFSGNLSRGEDWHKGILDPDEIANRREGVMKRHVIIMMVKNLMDWADHEFSLATASSLDRARQLYELAGEVLDSPDLADKCFQSVRELTVEIVTGYGLDPAGLVGTLVGIVEDLNLIDDPQIISQAVDDIRKVLPDPGNIDPSPVEKIVKKALAIFRSHQKPTRLVDQVGARHAEMATYEDQVLQFTASQSGDSISPYFFSTTGVNLLDINLARAGTGERIYTNSITFCVPPNPVLVALNAYIALSLLKFQLCLDISGEPLPAVVINEGSVAQFFDTLDAEVERQPLLDLPANWFNQPPRYRYSYLVEKARQYTDVAQRLGSALLAAHEKYDNEKLAILRAQHAIELASSTIDLRNLGLKDAVTGLELANLQSDRAEAQLDFWQDRIDSGMLSEKEQFGLFLMSAGAWLNVTAGVIQGIGAIAAFFGAGVAGTAAGGTAGSVEPGGGTVAGGAAGGAAGFSLGAALAAAVPGTAAALGSFAGALGTFGSINLTFAGFERRFEDWTFQRDLSDFDLIISDVQKESANNRVDIANQEMSISKLQNTQAKEVLSFLENKFSNDHLYEWMIQVLSQNYRTIMQISSNMAKHAQRALEFERQEKISIIVGDYWSVSAAPAFSGDLSEKQKDSGLLGSERLITDLTRLDAYRVSTEKRRLQLSKNISMANLMPGELVQLRTTGKITFNTLMHWFDRDFPGHYLRLIKSVRVSMLALTPPTDGIHATLSNNGESTVVVPDDIAGFKSIRAFRDFGETIALDSPFNETGLFVLNYDDPMFLPFEGLGVETQWALELPKASNRFNFDTIMDVMLTIEYTALHSNTHATNIKAQLGDTDVNDLPVNVRFYFPDEWYHFKNDPVEVDGTRKLNIQMPAQFLPQHYEKDQAISTIHITIMLTGNFDGLSTNGKKQLLDSVRIEHAYQDNNVQKTLKLISGNSPQAGEKKFNTKLIQAQDSQFALFSTRDSNNLSFQLDSGIDPTGEWRISIKDINLPNNKMLGEVLEDVLIVVTTEGRVNWG